MLPHFVGKSSTLFRAVKNCRIVEQTWLAFRSVALLVIMLTLCGGPVNVTRSAAWPLIAEPARYTGPGGYRW